ncbi:MAG: hypothetical protein IPP85_19180 [Propionivibrio sp.]|nr:hypothetical protein [Propionivibrio sp.]
MRVANSSFYGPRGKVDSDQRRHRRARPARGTHAGHGGGGHRCPRGRRAERNRPTICVSSGGTALRSGSALSRNRPATADERWQCLLPPG